MYHFEDIIVSLIFIIAHGLMFIMNYNLAKKVIMSPAVLFSLVWFIIVLLHFIFSFTLLDKLEPLSISVYLIFFIGVFAFSIGAFIETAYLQKKNKLKQIKQYLSYSENHASLLLKCFLILIGLIGLPFFIQASYKLFIASNLDNFFVGLRSEVSYGDVDLGPLKYLFALSLVAYAFILRSYFQEKNFINALLLVISFLITFTYAVFTTGRLLFLLILAVYLGIRFINNSKIFTLKKIINFTLIFMSVFILFGILYGKGGDLEGSATENIKPAAQGTAIYLVSSLNALQYQLHDQFRVSHNFYHTLRFFFKLGKALNLVPNAQVNNLIQPFVLIPYPTNVYTIYSPYIKDFGRAYAWLVIFFLGLLQTYLYNKAIEKKDFRNTIWYSLLLFSLLVSFFDDQYFSLISFWIQFAAFTEIIIFLNKILTQKSSLKNKYQEISFT